MVIKRAWPCKIKLISLTAVVKFVILSLWPMKSRGNVYMKVADILKEEKSEFESLIGHADLNEC